MDVRIVTPSSPTVPVDLDDCRVCGDEPGLCVHDPNVADELPNLPVVTVRFGGAR